MGARKITLFAITAAVIIAAVVLIALYYSGIDKGNRQINLPDVHTTDSGSTGTGNGDLTSGTIKYIEVTPDNVQDVIETIAKMSKPDSYYRKLLVAKMWEGGSASFDIETWIGINASRTNITYSDGTVKNIVISEGNIYVWYGEETEYFRVKQSDLLGDDTHLIDEFQMISTYEDILALEKNDIADAGYVEYEGAQCIFVKTSENELGYTDIYYVSLSNGLLAAAETLDGDFSVYRMLAVETDLTAPDEDAFVLPSS